MKKMLVIMLAVIMALSTAACGTVQPTTQTTPAPAVEVKPEVTPAPEVSEPEPTEAPKEESEATEVVEETPEVTEEASSDNPYVIDGIDFSAYYEKDGEFYHDGKLDIISEILYENANYDDTKVFVFGTKTGLEGVLSDGDSYEMTKEAGTIYFWYYTPKTLINVAIKSGNERASFGTQPSEHSDRIVVISRIAAEEQFEDLPQELLLTYDDGTEESVTIYVTQQYVRN